MSQPEWARRLHVLREAVARRLGPEALGPFAAGTAPAVRGAVASVLDEGEFDWPLQQGMAELMSEALVGWGSLRPLLDDPLVSDVLVNSWDTVYVERAGRLELTGAAFGGEGDLRSLLARLAAVVGRELSREFPVVDGELEGGLRFTAVLPPVGGPALCLRRSVVQRMTLEPTGDGRDLVSAGVLPAWLAQTLAGALRARCSVLISGATGSGKTTFLRALLAGIDPAERVVTIEDTAELQLQHPHLLSLQCTGSREPGARVWDVAALVEAAMRLRPDRLVVGEIRLAREAYQTLEALNTGHPGSATTIHANGAIDAVRRLEMLVGREFRQLTPAQTRVYVAGVIDLVVHLEKREGVRRVSTVVALDEPSDGAELGWCEIFPNPCPRQSWPARLLRRLEGAE